MMVERLLKTATPVSDPTAPPLTPYQKRLFVMLSVATFFEGYDFFALSQVLPNLRAEMQLSEFAGALVVSVINVGSIVAYFLVRQADRFGRKRIMSITIVGYTICSVASGLAPNIYVFTLLQLISRIFLIGEWATAMIYAAEEYPPQRRGMVMGVIQAFSSLGAIVCAGTAGLLIATPIGWRLIYFSGGLPLVLMIFVRRGLKETRSFSELTTTNAMSTPIPLLRIFTTSHRTKVLQLSVIWGLAYACSAAPFFKEYAVHERNMSENEVGLCVTIAALFSMPLVFLCGRLIDGAGRKRAAAIIFSIMAVSVASCFLLHGFWPITIALAGGIFGTSAMLAVMNTITAESVPTEFRGETFAWANNLLGRVSFVLAPLFIGFLADDDAFGAGFGLGWGWGPSVALTAGFPVIALLCIALWVKDSRGDAAP